MVLINDNITGFAAINKSNVYIFNDYVLHTQNYGFGRHLQCDADTVPFVIFGVFYSFIYLDIYAFM